MAPSPKKFKPTMQDLAQGTARISVTSWLAGMDPLVPAKPKKDKSPKKAKSPKKSPEKKPKSGWFSWNAKAKNNDSAYDADESSEDDVPLLKKKNGGMKSILKNGDEPGPVQPKKAMAKKPAIPCLKKTGGLEVIAEDTEDSNTLSESEASSAPVIIKKLKCKKVATPVADAETSEVTLEAPTTSVGETTDAETTSAGEDGAAAQSADEATQTAEATDDATQTAPETTDDEATQTAPVTTDDEAQPAPGAEAAPAVETAAAPAVEPVAVPAVEPIAAPADPDWTPSQDAMLMAMKEGGEPWKAIVAALGKSKKDCVARFKILQKNKEADSTAAGASAPPPAPTLAPAAPVSVNTATVVASPSPAKASPVKTSPTKTSTAKQSKKSKAKGKGKAASITPAPVDSPSDAGSGYSVDEHMERSSILEEETEQMLSRLYSAYSGRYSSQIKSDPNFSALDCRVLGVLEAKKKAEHWMELQAAFFNITGRMVPIELIKEKMGAE